MNELEFYGQRLPSAPEQVAGRLVVIEGPDNSGRSTQIQLLRDWLEGEGHAVIDVGLKRSNLVSKELDDAMEGNVLGKATLALFYATDFLDQLENKIIPALKAGYIVVADRYIYTLIARATVRGMDQDWITGVYSIVPRPDVVFYLRVDPTTLVERRFQIAPYLDYWESGMDIGLAGDMYTSFYAYQNRMRQEFQRLARKHDFHVIDGARSIEAIQSQMRELILPILGKEHPTAGSPRKPRSRRASVRKPRQTRKS